MTRTQVIQRVEFRGAAAQLRANAGIDRADEVAAITPMAEFGEAARRLRRSNVFVDEGTAEVAQVAEHHVEQINNRSVAGALDAARRRSALAGRASGLLAEIAAVRDDALRDAVGGSRRVARFHPAGPADGELDQSVSERVRDRLETRREFRAAAGALRTNVDEHEVEVAKTAVMADPTVGSAARRLRASVAA